MRYVLFPILAIGTGGLSWFAGESLDLAYHAGYLVLTLIFSVYLIQTLALAVFFHCSQLPARAPFRAA